MFKLKQYSKLEKEILNLFGNWSRAYLAGCQIDHLSAAACPKYSEICFPGKELHQDSSIFVSRIIKEIHKIYVSKEEPEMFMIWNYLTLSVSIEVWYAINNFYTMQNTYKVCYIWRWRKRSSIWKETFERNDESFDLP